MSPADEPGPAGLRGWFDARLPGLAAAWRRHATGYFVPRNLNFWSCFGARALLALAGQLRTGLFLAMHYPASASAATLELAACLARRCGDLAARAS